jgi:hypothetical protein
MSGGNSSFPAISANQCRVFLDMCGHGDYLRLAVLDFDPGTITRLNRWAVSRLAMPTERSLRRCRREI